MDIISIEGIIVSSIKYGESSKILNILTKDKGIIGVIAKGALKEKSKLRVVSNNFTYANFHICFKEGKLSTLVSADVINYFMNIKTDIVKFGYLGYLVDLARNVYKDNNSIDIYNILISALLKIEDNFNPKVIASIVMIKYLEYLGVGLYLDGCSVCDNTNVVSMSHSKGGYVCAKHATNEPSMDATVLKMFKAYYCIDISKISELNIKDKVIDEIDYFLTNYYKDYTGLYLKSRKFLENINSN